MEAGFILVELVDNMVSSGGHKKGLCKILLVKTSTNMDMHLYMLNNLVCSIHQAC